MEMAEVDRLRGVWGKARGTRVCTKRHSLQGQRQGGRRLSCKQAAVGQRIGLQRQG